MKILNAWLEGLIYPFKEKDWKSKMWLIPLIGILLTPVVQLIALRGWRVELVRRIGLKTQNILPKADLSTVLKYAIHGIKLWAISFVYLFIPIILFKILGINPFKQLFREIINLIGYFFSNNTGLPLSTLLWNSFWAIMYEILIQNMWLVFYYPYYRAASIRYALTGKLRKSHLAFMPNIMFVLRNVKEFISLMINQIVDKVVLFFLNAILTLILTPFISVFLFPMFLFFADFWASGYDYGQVAKKMAEQEYPELLNEKDRNLSQESELV